MHRNLQILPIFMTTSEIHQGFFMDTVAVLPGIFVQKNAYSDPFQSGPDKKMYSKTDLNGIKARCGLAVQGQAAV